MGGNAFWSATRLFTWAYFFPDFFKWCIPWISDAGFSSYADDNTL